MNNLTVITRTSNRPKYFERCYQSVKNQPWPCRHLVIYDDPNSESYLKGKNIEYHYVNSSKLKKNYNQPAPETARPKLLSIHNLYFNEAYKHIQDNEWIFHLDDDNYINVTSFHRIREHLSNVKADVIICKLKHFTGSLPRQNDFNKKNIRLCGIDTACIFVRGHIAKKIEWDGWKCGDFRFIEAAVKLAKNPIWINHEVAIMDQQNLGKRNDL